MKRRVKKREMVSFGYHPEQRVVKDKINDYCSLGDISAVEPKKYE